MLITVDHTANGRSLQPLSVGNLNYCAEMKLDSKKVLWENVLSLMVDRYKKENLTKLAKDSGIGPGTMTRIKEQETSVGVDTLEKLAVVAKVEPWQLLHPSMGKSNDSASNQPLALVNQAQLAINNVASLNQAMDVLLANIGQVDPAKRGMVNATLAYLVDHPDDDSARVNLVNLLTPSGFAESLRKAA